MPDIQKIIEGCRHCIYHSEYTYTCLNCPYAYEDACAKHLTDDVITALKRLEFLEKPTPEEQPELPGMG